VATEGLTALERLPERRFERDAEARLTAVRGEALLRENRAAEALPVLEKALALHLAQYDSNSPPTAKVRLALTKAQGLAAPLSPAR
jgi:serine/threonine-protein kinase